MSLIPCFQSQPGWRALATVALLASIFVSFAQDTSSPPPAPRRSSIILIVADGVGCNDISCYGSKQIKTPNLDELAAEGARFTSFYAGSTADSPSRAALMLGMHTGHLNIRDDSSGATLQANDQTFSQLLQAAGYRTGLIGTWGLSDGASGLPQNKGFEQFAGFLKAGETVNEYPEFIDRYDTNLLEGTFEGRVQLYKNAEGQRGQHITDLCTEAAMNFVRIARPEPHNNYRPFFLMLAYPTPQAARQSQTERDASIARMDTDTGQLLTKLKDLKIDTNTIVIFTSSSTSRVADDGGGNLSENRLRVPLIVRWPARLKPATVSEPWAAWDVFPTMTDIARMDCPTNVDGVSFYQTLLGKAQTNRHDSFYWEIQDAAHGSQQAARLGNWKAIRRAAKGPLELYDLKSDPNEKNNVAGKHPDVTAKFEKFFKTAGNESSVSN